MEAEYNSKARACEAAGGAVYKERMWGVLGGFDMECISKKTKNGLTDLSWPV